MTENQALQIGPDTELEGYPFEIITAEEATGIDEIRGKRLEVRDNVQWSTVNGQWYDLNGRKVTKLAKGRFYIVNGAKVFIP